MPDADPCVLVVEDEAELAELYAKWLSETYRVETAYGGPEALNALDALGAEIDVALLDRRMDAITGDDVLAEIRDRDLDCQVSMVTAVTPDFDIIELSFDEYFVKPLSKNGLVESVAELLDRRAYDETVQELLTLVSKRDLLEREKDSPELIDVAPYEELTDRIDALREQLDDRDESLPPPARQAIAD
ncbi:MAG: response regulator containing CheY-like receiver, AAA-type ATPase, and DNA-binding domain protein [uncultured archaeon A07HN63]|nr:MAG: response regulator containing CheY-like receiver, AAA-type ATPase, and DNA-binding domain protein [uncultured archaeon A07HN63]